MKRAVMIGSNPYIRNVYKKSAQELFDETGGNSGNLAFMFAMSEHIVGAAHMGWSAPAGAIRNAGDVIVLALANQLGPHTDLGSAATKLREFGLPVIAIGLGAQAATAGSEIKLTDGTADWLDTLAAMAPTAGPNIGVRGTYTQEQISRLGYPTASAVTGCPSNFINPDPDLGNIIAHRFKTRPRHIAVCGGIPYIPQLRNLERDLCDLVSGSGGAYIVQHGLQMLQLARNEFDLMPSETLENCRDYMRPDDSTEQFKAWCRHHAVAFYDVRAWMDYIRRFDFVIGTRFHGAMLAIQAGVPAACITHDSRTAEMCETMGIPARHYNEIKGSLTRYNLLDFFDFDASGYTEKRHYLCARFKSMLIEADVPCSKRLSSL
jgi:hypothetical protein